MKRIHYINGGLLGVVTAFFLIVLFYLGRFAGLPFVPFDLFDFMARQLPGVIVTFGIDLLVSLITTLSSAPIADSAKFAEQFLAFFQFLIFGGIIGWLLTLYLKRPSARINIASLLSGIVISVLFLAAEAILVTLNLAVIFWISIPVIIWTFILGRSISIMSQKSVQQQPPLSSRRTFLYLLASSFGVLALGITGISKLLLQVSSYRKAESIPTEPIIDSPSPEQLANRLQPVPGTRPEITSNENFYRIDINLLPKNISPDEWELIIDGMVENPLTLNLTDIYSRPSVSRYITLSCISNPIGGDLISTSLWTGIPLSNIINEAGLHPDAAAIYIEAADGFYESVGKQDIMDERTILVYGMNGKPLPDEHGFPLRIYIPNRYGMKQPKWITRITAIDTVKPGYWVNRGWSKEAFVKTVSVIDNAEMEADIVALGGIAFAGERGISKVEIRIDDENWQPAELRNPALSPLTWVQWRFNWQKKSGKHTAQVRAYDGQGNLQILTKSSRHPSGATGIHTFSFEV